MTTEGSKRKLSAILSADVKEYRLDKLSKEDQAKNNLQTKRKGVNQMNEKVRADVRITDKEIFGYIYHYSGLKFIFRKFVPLEKSKIPTGVLWLIGIYIAMFGVASQRYENRIDIIENRANSIFAQLASSDVDVRTGVLSKIPRVQNMSCPYKPKLFNPQSIFLSFFSYSKYDEMVDLLKETIESWKMSLDSVYLAGANLQKARLRGANLQEAYLMEADLQGASLREANLRGAILLKANLQGAVLSGANLQGANLNQANLQEASLGELIDRRRRITKGANLQKAYLRGANLQKARLRGANLQEADLLGANLQGANLNQANLQEAYLREANLQEADLREADLRRANLDGTNLRMAKGLTKSMLRETTNYPLARYSKEILRMLGLPIDHNERIGKKALQGYNLQGADLRGAKLQKANLREANLGEANLQKAILLKANLQGAVLRGANLQEANLMEADLQGASLMKADLRGAVLMEANLQGAKNFAIEQLSKVETLHKAKLDPELQKRIKKDYPQLLEAPKYRKLTIQIIKEILNVK